MPEAAGLRGSELRRKLVHLSVGGFAFLLRYLTWPQAAALAIAAFLFNWKALPLLGGRGLWRGADVSRGYPLGILLYPLSVLGLILAFREDLWMAAACWGILAFGDGMASVMGLGVGGRRLPWNAAKSWSGLVAFVVFGALGAGLLIAWTLGLPLSAVASSRIVWLAVPLALACAFVESLPTTLDDNLTVPLVGAAVLSILQHLEPAQLLGDPALASRLAAGALVNAAVALLAMRARSIDGAGALSAVVIGTGITAGTGLGGFALMAAFFVLGSAATRLGYRIKAERGIAQERGGARGARNAWANGGVPVLLALSAGMAPPALRELFVIAFAGSVATAACDTCSSEMGKAFGRRTFLVTTLRPVPPGTEGAVSVEGTLAGLAGGAAVAALGAALGLYGWPAALLVTTAAFLGGLAESVIGTVAERRGWLDNDQLNALNTALGAAAAYALATAFGVARA